MAETQFFEPLKGQLSNRFVIDFIEFIKKR